MTVALLPQAIQFVQHNQLLAGMGAATFAGAFISRLRAIPTMIGRGVRRVFIVELRVNSADTPFAIIDHWLSEHPATKRSRSLSISTRHHTDDGEEDQDRSWYMAPGIGLHWFLWRRRFLWVERTKIEKAGADRVLHEIRVCMLTRSVKPMWALVSEAYAAHVEQEGVQVRVLERNWWTTLPGRSPRPMETLTLPPAKLEALLADLDWFKGARDWHRKRGITYKRGYLFSGPPGTGKTSLVLALATYLGRPLCLINLSAVPGDDALVKAIGTSPSGAILLIEDIDSAKMTHSREENDEGDSGQGVTLGGLLNALDGVASSENRIIIFTTNYPERLDPALIRPGRADVHVRFEHLEAEDQVRMASRFYEDRPFRPLEIAVSPARLQAAFQRHPNDPEKAHEDLMGDEAI